MEPTTFLLTPTEKTAVLRILTETGHNLATDREILFLLFPRDSNRITFNGLDYLAIQYAVDNKTLPGRLGHIAKLPHNYFAIHRETYPEMYNHLGELIGYPFPSVWGSQNS